MWSTRDQYLVGLATAAATMYCTVVQGWIVHSVQPAAPSPVQSGVGQSVFCEKGKNTFTQSLRLDCLDFLSNWMYMYDSGRCSRSFSGVWSLPWYFDGRPGAQRSLTRSVFDVVWGSAYQFIGPLGLSKHAPKHFEPLSHIVWSNPTKVIWTWANWMI